MISFARAGNQRGHVIGVLALDRFIVVAVDNPRRHFDVAQLLVGKMRLARPHLLDIRLEGVELRGRRRESRVLLPCALEKGWKTGLLPTSFTPDGSELAANANSRVRRCG